MARAATIWVLTTQGGAEPALAFTVKHELLTHMHRFGGLQGRNVFRLPDGSSWGSPTGSGEITSWPAPDFLATYG